MGSLRPIWRGLRLIEHVFTGALVSLYLSLAAVLVRPPVWTPSVVRWWHARLCRALGIRVRVRGRALPGRLLVANHISWLDVPVLGAQAELVFLSKSEVRHWPLVGWMAAVAGTLFIERGANQVGRAGGQLADEIARGRTPVIFPEGTTSEGLEVRRFHARLFAVAQRPGFEIQPVALRYRRGADETPDAGVAFVGDELLLVNLWRVIRHPDLIAEVRFLPSIQVRPGEDRRSLSLRARASILEALGLDDPPKARSALPFQGYAGVPDPRCASGSTPGRV